MDGIRESFLLLDFFSITLKFIFMALYRGGGRSPPSPPPHGSAIALRGSGSPHKTRFHRPLQVHTPKGTSIDLAVLA